MQGTWGFTFDLKGDVEVSFLCGCSLWMSITIVHGTV